MLKTIKNPNHFYMYLMASSIKAGDGLKMFLCHIFLCVLMPQIPNLSQ